MPTGRRCSRSRRTARSRSPRRCSPSAASRTRATTSSCTACRPGYGVDLATVLVSPEPFSRADSRRSSPTRRASSASRPCSPTASPRIRCSPRLTAPGGPGRRRRRARGRHLAADRQPPVLLPDGRPRHVLRRRHLARRLRHPARARARRCSRSTVLALAAVCVVVPAADRPAPAARSCTSAASRSSPTSPASGSGFLLVEVSLLQRLSIFLGHPTYGLTVVLFSMLVFSGIGSMCTERVVRSERPAVVARAAARAARASCVVHGFVAPRILERPTARPRRPRIATAVAILAPLAFMLGMPFSIGMRAAARSPETPTAFLWAINGAASVCASVLGVVIALFFGISAAFWAGALAYVLACASMAFITRGTRPSPASRRRTGSTSPTGPTTDPRVSVPAG